MCVCTVVHGITYSTIRSDEDVRGGLVADLARLGGRVGNFTVVPDVGYRRHDVVTRTRTLDIEIGGTLGQNQPVANQKHPARAYS